MISMTIVSSDCIKLSQELTNNSHIWDTTCYPALETSINYALQQSQGIHVIFIHIINAEKMS